MRKCRLANEILDRPCLINARRLGGKVFGSRETSDSGVTRPTTASQLELTREAIALGGHKLTKSVQRTHTIASALMIPENHRDLRGPCIDLWLLPVSDAIHSQLVGLWPHPDISPIWCVVILSALPKWLSIGTPKNSP